MSNKKMQEFTFEEFCDTPMQYRIGMLYERGAQRLYRNDSIGIQKEVFTKRNPLTGQFGKSKTFFFLDCDSRQFTTVDQLYVAYMERACFKNDLDKELKELPQ